MNKRQKKKLAKKWLIKAGYSADGKMYCLNCSDKLDYNNKWQMMNGACDRYCYGKAVGVY